MLNAEAHPLQRNAQTPVPQSDSTFHYACAYTERGCPRSSCRSGGQGTSPRRGRPSPAPPARPLPPQDFLPRQPLNPWKRFLPRSRKGGGRGGEEPRGGHGNTRAGAAGAAGAVAPHLSGSARHHRKQPRPAPSLPPPPAFPATRGCNGCNGRNGTACSSALT